MSDQRFPKSSRILKQLDFDRVYHNDAFVADNVLVIKGVANGTDTTRLGLSVGRKVGNAVVRNRWKRLIRESFRKQQSELPPGLDLVIRPRKGAQPDFESVFRSIAKLVIRLKKRIESSPSGGPS